MDRSRKPEVLSRTSQVKWTTGQMVLKVARLRLYPTTYSGKTNTKADILSRKYQVDTKEDNKDVQLLKDEM